MEELIINAKYYLILFISPIIGLIFHFKIARKARVYLLIISIIMLTPALFGFRYIINYVYQILGILFLSSGYSFMIDKITKGEKKVIISVIVTVLLFLMLGFFTFLSAFGGTLTIEKEWEIDNYKVEYIRDQGFSGRPLMKYNLNKYSIFPFLIKTIETSTRKDSINNCIIYFNDRNIIFDKCKNEINKTMR